ncbi:ABC-type amino acid transport substrate-binding protein [Krasilnikovia cinnamomea]|uniref:ABC-type amino acid transport substrate-binding protein n=1 Tax=Krasilnikovia cinnamomea TaxID=349313 RepID=A0A4Q7ZG97_9ACTN|nr:transporter substrate-binding domain-containing protein [Krasilnikovia cinnamomea]RZU49183.1 ABC-type amino acid transport substrate-binding protein [Krasilnikovia cinnamomea]
MALGETGTKYLQRAFWLSLTVAGILFGIRFHLTSSDGGGILTWLVPVVTAVVGFLLGNPIRTDGVSQRRLIVNGSLCLLAIIGMGTLAVLAPWRTQTDDDPQRYLGRPLRIGVTTGSLDGWSRGGSSNGFDSALADFIAARFHTTWEAVPVFGHDRVQMLEQGEVDLIIATFTINEPRAQRVDMAGPYFIDTTGVWMNAAKAGVPPDEAKLCQAEGTTGVGAAGQFRRQYLGRKFAIVDTEQTTVECIDKLRRRDDKTTFVATDWSILRAADTNLNILDGNDYLPRDVDVRGYVLDPGPPPGGDPLRSSDLQRYGVALRNNHPRVCAALTDVINEFLARDDGFAAAYDQNLQAILGAVQGDWHNPRRADAPGTPNSYSCM